MHEIICITNLCTYEFADVQQVDVRERKLQRNLRKAPSKTVMTELQMTLPPC